MPDPTLSGGGGFDFPVAAPDVQTTPSEADTATLSPQEHQLVGGGGGAALSRPDTANMPATSRPPMPPPQPPAPTIDDKHNIIGRAARHIASALEGKQINYVPDPETGAYKEVVTPRKAGGFFRDVVLGSVIGGAAAADSDPAQGFTGGLVRGAGASIQDQRTQDSKAKTRALELGGYQKGKADSDKAQKTADDIAAGTLATHTMSTLDFDHHANLHTAGQIDAHNRSTDVLLQAARDNGGATPQISGPDGDLNGKADNGGELMKLFQQNPEAVMQAPEGFHRTPFASVDTSGLKYESGKWMDPKTGKEADLADRTTFTLVDIPVNAWNKSLTVTKGNVNDVMGRTAMSGNAGDSTTTTFGQLFGLGLRATKDRAAQRQEATRPPKDDKEAAGWASMKAPDDATDQEKAEIQSKVDRGDRFLQKFSGAKQDEKGPTAASQKEQRLKLEGLLTKGTIGPDDRNKLVEMQKQDAMKGVPDDIKAAIGPKPVPAMFVKGEDDPQYRAAAKLWGDASLNKKSALAASSGLARYQMLGAIRDYNVTNTGNDPIQTSNGVIQPGETGRVTANDAMKMPPQVILNTQDGTKILSKQAAIGDIQYNIDNTKDKIGALENLDFKTRAKLAVALRSPDPVSALNTLQTSEARAFADEKLQDAMIALTSMSENVMLLRSVQGVGGAGSDMMRHALMDLIPSAGSPTKGYALKQMDVLQRTLNQLKKGVPTTGGGSPKTATAPPTSHVFSLARWKAANPSGDTEKAKAAAQKAGYQVTD